MDDFISNYCRCYCYVSRNDNSNIFLASLIESILTVFVSVYLYEMKLNVCVAVFYEELDYEDKYENMQAQDEGM